MDVRHHALGTKEGSLGEPAVAGNNQRRCGIVRTATRAMMLARYINDRLKAPLSVGTYRLGPRNFVARAATKRGREPRAILGVARSHLRRATRRDLLHRLSLPMHESSRELETATQDAPGTNSTDRRSQPGFVFAGKVSRHRHDYWKKTGP